jgi:hypothetical protein
MVDRRRRRTTLKDRAEYTAALARFEALQGRPLGTPETAGLDDLTEAIDNYESRHRVGEFRSNSPLKAERNGDGDDVQD